MPRHALPTTLSALLSLSLLTACQTVYIVDDVDWSSSFDLIPDDDLHGPHVQGSQISFDGHSASTVIRSRGAVEVGSTNDLGCAAGRAHGAAALACLLLGIALRRRRRRLRDRQRFTSPSAPPDRV